MAWSRQCQALRCPSLPASRCWPSTVPATGMFDARRGRVMDVGAGQPAMSPDQAKTRRAGLVQFCASWPR